MALPRRIMIVDDSSEFCDAISLILSVEAGPGPEIGTTFSGEEALCVFGRFGLDLIFVDHMLPGMDGLETAGRLKQEDPQAKVVLMTAGAVEVLRTVASEWGVDAVVGKSEVSPSRLMRLINSL